MRKNLRIGSVCRKSFAFSQTVSLFQMEKRASPLFQAFFPLQPRFFLNQAAVFRQSQPMRKNLCIGFLYPEFSTKLSTLLKTPLFLLKKCLQNSLFCLCVFLFSLKEKHQAVPAQSQRYSPVLVFHYKLTRACVKGGFYSSTFPNKGRFSPSLMLSVRRSGVGWPSPEGARRTARFSRRSCFW